METIYAMGACVDPPIATLSGINFLEDKTSNSGFQNNLIEYFMLYKEILFILVMCLIFLAGIHILFQTQLKVVQLKYNQLSQKEGADLYIPVTSIQSDLSDANDKGTAFKNIRMKSNVVPILLRISSHIPLGSKLKSVAIDYNEVDANDKGAHVALDLEGNVVGGDSNAQLTVVNQIYTDFKNDKDLSQYVKSIDLISINSSEKSTDFTIHGS
jgi:hypothetical protein